MSANSIRCAVLSLVLSALASCASVQSPGATTAGDEDRVIEVTNNNWQAAVVYAVHAGQRVRIGTVETGRTAVLRLPATGGDTDVSVFVHLLGGGSYMSEVIPSYPGARIVLNLQNRIAASYFTVR